MMKKILLILPLLFWIGCEEEKDEEAPIYPLLTEFPLDKEFACSFGKEKIIPVNSPEIVHL